MEGQGAPRVFLSRQSLEALVGQLAQRIRKDFQHKPLLVIGVLKGSFIFLADLVRRLDLPLEIDFIGLSSYCQGTTSSGKIRVTRPLCQPVTGRDVLVVEDIVDTGLTTKYLMSYLRRQKPASLRLCALIAKPDRHEEPVNIDYLGTTVPDKFIVGYGLDYNGKFRNLPDLCFLPEPPP